MDIQGSSFGLDTQSVPLGNFPPEKTAHLKTWLQIPTGLCLVYSWVPLHFLIATVLNKVSFV